MQYSTVLPVLFSLTWFFYGSYAPHLHIEIDDTSNLTLTDPEQDSRRFCGLAQNSSDINDCEWFDYIGDSAEGNIAAFVVAGVFLIFTTLHWLLICCCRPFREPKSRCDDIGLWKPVIMFILSGFIIAGAILFLIGHLNPNIVTDSDAYIETKFSGAVDFGNYLVSALENLSVKYDVEIDTSEIEDVVDRINEGIEDYRDYSDRLKLALTIIASVIFALSVILAFVIFVYPHESYRAILYFYIFFGFVLICALSVYIAALGWEKTVQGDLCAETLYNEGFFTILMDELPYDAIDQLDQVDEEVHKRTFQLCTAIGAATATNPGCCSDLTNPPCSVERFCCDVTSPDLYINSTIIDNGSAHLVPDCITECASASLRQLSQALVTASQLQFDAFIIFRRTERFFNEYSESTIRYELNGLFCPESNELLYVGLAILCVSLHLALWIAVILRQTKHDNGVTCCCFGRQKKYETD